MNKTVDRLFAIYGASGCGRGVMPVANEMLRRNYGDDFKIVFIDDAYPLRRINERDVLTYEEFRRMAFSYRAVNIAVSDSRVRERLAKRCHRDGIDTFTVHADNAKVMDDVQIQPGAFLAPFVTLTSNIRVGAHFHANLYSYIEHDCIIGDFVTFAPGVHCNGNVVVEDHAYLGSGCLIRQGRADAPLVIGRGAIIGMGAVVTRSVPAGVTVIGNPARPM